MLTETYPRTSLSGYELSPPADARSSGPLSPAESQRARDRLDGCAAFAVVAVSSSLIWFVGTWFLSGWVVM